MPFSSLCRSRRPVLQAMGLLAALASLLATSLGAQETPRVIAFGDSITAGLREPGVECRSPSTHAGYSPKLAARLAALGEPISLGISGVCGEETAQALSRIDSVLAAGPVDVLLLMEGTNDISSGAPIIGIETMRDNLDKIAIKAEAAGAVVVHSSVIPFGPGAPGNTKNNGRAFALTTELDLLAEVKSRPFVNAFDVLYNTPGIFERFYHEDGYHLNVAGNGLLAEAFIPSTLEALSRDCEEPTPCVPDADTMCLNAGRFAVEVDWQRPDGSTGVGTGERLSSETGRFWFFDPDNIELLVKVLDARCLNGHFWVFFGALSNVEYTMTVRDSETCAVRTYRNPQGTFASQGDTSAFPSPPPLGLCPEG